MTTISISQPSPLVSPLESLIDYAVDVPNIKGVPFWALPPPADEEARDILDTVTTLHARGRALRSMVGFSRHFVGVEPALHHTMICQAIDDMFNDDAFDILVVMSPPASAKSTYVSVAAPACIIARNPTAKIISVSRSADLATQFGGRVKAIIESDEYRLATGLTISSDTRAKNDWRTTSGASYYAVGSSGGVLGLRADVVICDDIHTSFEDAQSETQLQKIRNWFESDLLSRLTPTGKLIVIGQRLNANDIIGYVLQRARENPSLRLKLLKFTAECDDPDNDPLGRTRGERMWPEFYTPSYLDDKKRDKFIWKTLWMQEPPSEDGSWVPSEHLRILPADDPVFVTSSLHRYLCIDLALSINSGDCTVILTVGVDARGMVYVLDAWRDRAAIEVTTDRLLDLVATHTPLECLIDDDNAAKVFMQLVASRGRERRIVPPMKMLPMRGQDKETRAAPLRGLFRSDRVFLKRAPWNEWLIRELLIFPNAMGAGVDDGVDALGLIGRRLASLSRPASPPAAVAPPPTTSQMCLEDLYDDRDRARGAFSRKRF